MLPLQMRIVFPSVVPVSHWTRLQLGEEQYRMGDSRSQGSEQCQGIFVACPQGGTPSWWAALARSWEEWKAAKGSQRSQRQRGMSFPWAALTCRQCWAAGSRLCTGLCSDTHRHELQLPRAQGWPCHRLKPAENTQWTCCVKQGLASLIHGSQSVSAVPSSSQSWVCTEAMCSGLAMAAP